MPEFLTADEWTRYWEKGTITTFHGKFENNYDGPIKAYWHDIFSQTKSESKLIDLATGNGALALLAQEYSRQHDKRFQIAAIDSADIRPAAVLANAKSVAADDIQAIEFYPRIPIEQTKFADQTFDLAISQFGIEYSNLQNAAAELDRISKNADARIACLVHHQDSVILSQAADSIRQIMLCEASELPQHIVQLMRRINRARRKKNNIRKDAQAERLRSEVNRRIGILLRYKDQFKDPSHIRYYVTSLMGLFEQNVLKSDRSPFVTKGINGILLEQQAFKRRMLDLQAAAQSDQSINSFTSLLERHGFEVEPAQPLLFRDKLFAYSIDARR